MAYAGVCPVAQYRILGRRLGPLASRNEQGIEYLIHPGGTGFFKPFHPGRHPIHQ